MALSLPVSRSEEKYFSSTGCFWPGRGGELLKALDGLHGAEDAAGRGARDLDGAHDVARGENALKLLLVDSLSAGKVQATLASCTATLFIDPIPMR